MKSDNDGAEGRPLPVWLPIDMLDPTDPVGTLNRLGKRLRSEGAYHLAVGHIDRPGVIGKIVAEITEKFVVIQSLLRRPGEEPLTPRLEFILRSGLEVADQLHRTSALNNLIKHEYINYIEVNMRPTRVVKGLYKVFVAYDFYRSDVAQTIDKCLDGTVSKTGHCGRRNPEWQKYVEAQIKQSDAILGVMPNREVSPSPNVLWEYVVSRNCGKPYRWLVSDAVSRDVIPADNNVIVYMEYDPGPSISHAIQSLLDDLHIVKQVAERPLD